LIIMELRQARKIVIIGGGQAGAQAAISLRQWGFEGSVTLIGDETALPYQRPPLSKAFLKGDLPEERLYFKPANWYQDNDVELIMGGPAAAIDRGARQVRLEHGGSVEYDALVLATGSRPRKLPVAGAQLDNVHELRTVADVDRLRPQMMSGKRIVIVGAGYIGLEAAAVARQVGLDVTVLEMAPRVLARVTSPLMSAFYESEHRAQGVEIRTGARLEEIVGQAGAVSGVRLAGGEELAADLVLVGIGILPNQELAAQAGLACRDGVLVDRDARTSDPRIFACGDCARRPLVHYGRDGRLESVHNAIEQGKLAAAAILARKRPPEEAPWFWSDQYDLKLQIAGLSEGYDNLLVRGDRAERKFAAFYLKQGRIISVDAVNAAPEFLASKRLIVSAELVDPERLTDMSVSMKEIAAQPAA
jgi:3-phenylpropionate/trans-cinnamate dioxygenase ferredoxin reductase component